MKISLFHNNTMGMVWQAGMITGATIHMRAGLNMTITQRVKIPYQVNQCSTTV